METKSSKIFRRVPSQSRSRMLVHSVLAATRRILPSEDFRRFTTQKVADVAGIGIGSLYEYFYSKESILQFVLEREIDRNLAQFESRLEELQETDLGAISDSLIDHFFDYFYTQKRLMHNLLFSLPREVTAGVILQSRIQVTDKLEKLLVRRFAHLGAEPDLRARLFFVVNTTLECIHSYFFIEEQGTPLLTKQFYKENIRVIARAVLRQSSV
ncbi:TetR/AcrR family transcriptional regulator [bacterium]|nr:TetR/AcrR family transcriptional regulator [bacterium]